jgi:phosphoserine/homoserine phosphotransferase
VILICLDLEGVLVPEIWIALAERVGVPELRRTTRDEPDYDRLMQYRLALLEKHGIGMSDIARTIAELDPLPGACAFLEWLRARAPLVILSDTFGGFARPLLPKLGYPALFCHELQVEDDRVRGYRLRMPDHKRAAVRAFRGLHYRTVAAGDSYNDTAMLGEADAGILFRAPANVVAEFPQFPLAQEYAELRAAIELACTRLGAPLPDSSPR